jgi:hypothetical protein
MSFPCSPSGSKMISVEYILDTSFAGYVSVSSERTAGDKDGVLDKKFVMDRNAKIPPQNNEVGFPMQQKYYLKNRVFCQ